MEWLFWTSIVILIYTYAGYPIQLAIQGKLRPAPVHRDAIQPNVVMVVVGYNEGHRIASKIDTCLKQDYDHNRLHILVASDGSTDNMCKIVETYPASRVSLLANQARRGKAACLNDAVAHTTQPIIVFTDARQRLHPQAVSRLVANFADPKIGAVSGELVFEDEDGTPFSEGIGAYWKYEKFIREHEALSGSVVGVTGALYAIRRDCYYPIPAETILDDVAIPMMAAMHGWRISFESGAIAYDQPSRDANKEKIRKVRTLAGNFQLLHLIKGLTQPWTNPLWVRFLAHKVLRLICPIALVAALVSHAVLAINGGDLYRWTFGIHVSGYLVVIASMVMPRLQTSMPLRLCATFLHLNLFVVLGFLSYASRQQSHLWNRSTSDRAVTGAQKDTP